MHRMVFAVLLLALLAASAPFARPGQAQDKQGNEVTVRLYWVQNLSEARLVPRDDLRLRACRTCPLTAATQPVTLRAAGGRLQKDSRTVEGGETETSGRYRLEVPGHDAVTFTHPMTIRAQGDRLLLTLRLPLEDYMAAVLAGESSNFDAEESRKAMAVAVRTYAVHFRGRHQTEGFDFCDTTHCQDARFVAVTGELRGAVEATEGEMLWYAGLPAATFYHRHCGGATEAAENAWSSFVRQRQTQDKKEKIPYLRQVTDNFCVSRDRDEWHSEITKAELRAALAAAGVAGVPQRIENVDVASRTPSGRVARLRLRGSAVTTLTAETLRLAVGRALGWERIRSDLYEIRETGDRFVFNGYGAGHGVGLCQAGAAEMGRQGRRYDEILAFYYPGTALGLTASGLAWQARGDQRAEVVSTRPREDEVVLVLVERLISRLEQETGWKFRERPQLRIYPSVAVFRNATGQPGWVAASARGRVIRMQPAEVLRAAGTLDFTVAHELAHLLIESHARPGLPMWFREGLALALSGERPSSSYADRLDLAALERALAHPRSKEEMLLAYRVAHARVARLVEKHAKGSVLQWVERGLPAGVE